VATGSEVANALKVGNELDLTVMSLPHSRIVKPS